MNKCEFIGNVGKDPAFAVVGEDKREMAKFSIAVPRKNNREKVDWVNLIVFGTKVTSIVKPFVKKGTKIAVVAEYSAETYTDKEGNSKYSTSFIVDEIDLLGSVNPDEVPSKTVVDEAPASDAKPVDTGDDLPF